jgi:hypothetical protein
MRLMYLPVRRKKEKRTKPVSALRSPKHLRHIRGLTCVVQGCTTGKKVVAAHIRAGLPPGEMAGTGIKPADVWTFPACVDHHAEEHEGTKSFQAKYGINLVKVAHALACNSEIPEVRQYAQRFRV